MKTHIFVKHCVDFDSILLESNIDKMLKIVFGQSKTEEARLRVDFANYKDYGVDEWCPAYFGMFGEWLCWHFLNHYGHLFNVEAVEMGDSIDSSSEDYGTDGEGRSVKDQLMKTTFRKAVKGSPVYVQVKATMNKTKEYRPNDGSRLPNFGLNAMSSAIRSGHAYQGRYIVFTTGLGLHYSLDKMSNGMIEVIGYKKIKALMNNDTVFLNRLRASVGLAEYPVTLSTIDPESALILAEVNDKE